MLVTLLNCVNVTQVTECCLGWLAEAYDRAGDWEFKQCCVMGGVFFIQLF